MVHKQSIKKDGGRDVIDNYKQLLANIEETAKDLLFCLLFLPLGTYRWF